MTARPPLATVRLVPRCWLRRCAQRTAAALLLAIVVLALPAVPPASAAHASPPDRTFTYDVQQRGEVATELEDFARHAAATLHDGRGWSLGGSLAFSRVPAGGDLTLWLAEETAVRSFSSGCSPAYSCRVADAVVINETRWRTATPSWTGSLDDYRRYVVLHEVGHWLQQGHVGCPGQGQPAPVMLQQSISLAGCTANPWPLAQERMAVARQHDVQVRPDRPAGRPAHGDGGRALAGPGSQTASLLARARKLLAGSGY
jgi:hypothetical protein